MFSGLATAPPEVPSSRGKKFGMPSNLITRFVGGTVASFSKALKRTQDLEPVESTTDLEINAWLENLSREVKEEVKSPVKKKAAVRKPAPSTSKIGSRSTAKKTSPVKKKAK